MTQFPRAIHHAILTTDLTQDALDEDNQSHNMSAMMGSNIDKDEFYEKGVDMLAARDN